MDLGQLKCNKVGHNNEPVQLVCLKQRCHASLPCCLKCAMEDHNDHNIKDFEQFKKIKESVLLNQPFLTQILLLSTQIGDLCISWKNEIEKLIEQYQLNSRLVHFHTSSLTQLKNWVSNLKYQLNRQKCDELIKNYNEQFTMIQLVLENLMVETSSLLHDSILGQNQLQEQNGKYIYQDKNLDNLKFKLTQQYQGHQDKVGYVDISYDDKYLVSGSFNNDVILWDLNSNKSINKYKTQYLTITSLQFSNDNSMLVVGSFDPIYGKGGVIEIFDLININSIQAQKRLEGHKDIIRRIRFINDSKYLISLCDDRSLRVWDLQKLIEINRENFETYQYAVAYSSKKELIACSGDKGQACLFDCNNLNNLILKQQWQPHSQKSWCIEFIQDSNIVMTSSDEETRFWLVDDILKNKFSYFKQIKEGGWTVKAYPLDNPQVIINCSSDWKFVNIWKYKSNELIESFEVSDGLQYRSFAITSEFKKIITGGLNKRVNIFECIDY